MSTGTRILEILDQKYPPRKTGPAKVVKNVHYNAKMKIVKMAMSTMMMSSTMMTMMVFGNRDEVTCRRELLVGLAGYNDSLPELHQPVNNHRHHWSHTKL